MSAPRLLLLILIPPSLYGCRHCSHLIITPHSRAAAAAVVLLPVVVVPEQLPVAPSLYQSSCRSRCSLSSSYPSSSGPVSEQQRSCCCSSSSYPSSSGRAAARRSRIRAAAGPVLLLPPRRRRRPSEQQQPSCCCYHLVVVVAYPSSSSHRAAAVTLTSSARIRAAAAVALLLNTSVAISEQQRSCCCSSSSYPSSSSRRTAAAASISGQSPYPSGSRRAAAPPTSTSWLYPSSSSRATAAAPAATTSLLSVDENVRILAPTPKTLWGTPVYCNTKCKVDVFRTPEITTVHIFSDDKFTLICAVDVLGDVRDLDDGSEAGRPEFASQSRCREKTPDNHQPRFNVVDGYLPPPSLHPFPSLSPILTPKDFNKRWYGTIQTRPTTTSHAPSLIDGRANLGRMQIGDEGLDPPHLSLVTTDCHPFARIHGRRQHPLPPPPNTAVSSATATHGMRP
ncbi:hypothetical protein BDZ97DRAFT_1928159 [Flammula alnicola]|nr:hypothetical protein BDZ97DRAFT_1928159 [Flammula alnicola]